MWNSNEFNDLRTSFLKNEKNKVCDRCWRQEDHGNQSLRKRLLINNPNKQFKKGELIPFLENGYINGPSQINIMVGNTCNLRCRICSTGSSSTYGIEGEYYKKKYNLDNYIGKRKKPIKLSNDSIDQIFNLGKNLKRIEFYGGEPLLDIPTLSLLEKLIASGQNKNITPLTVFLTLLLPQLQAFLFL
jgi:MoaA/NifB/PqqE/SkfB family radical SAM enzyme